ncbi:unnamed protein product [Dovyalis caffra]|uniref:Uncharacterized protein n=1 Tax=Dovyalis caffra TaxID=77055 RepID=A0AAV1SN13_9ROSI|nr:unnamed protein product [Dovyalis caffra]
MGKNTPAGVSEKGKHVMRVVETGPESPGAFVSIRLRPGVANGTNCDRVGRLSPNDDYAGPHGQADETDLNRNASRNGSPSGPFRARESEKSRRLPTWRMLPSEKPIVFLS